MLRRLLILFYILSFTHAHLRANPWEPQTLSPAAMPLTPPAMPQLPLPANLPLFYSSRRKIISPFAAPSLGLAPTQPPRYGPFLASHHPPLSSRLSKPSMKKGGLVPPSSGFSPPRFAEIAPVQSGASTLPAGLAQPPLSPHTSSTTSCKKPL